MLAFSSVRPSYVAGAFYPSDPKELSNMIEDFLSRANPPKLEGKLMGIQVPHAGYIYSGKVAAYAYKLIQGRKYELVVLIGPSHFYPFSGGAVYPEGEWKTPLGEVKIDEDFASKLIKEKMGFFAGERYHVREHSLEVELPFLQKVLKPGFKIVPIVIGPYNPQRILQEAGKFAKLLKGKNFLVIASSDLSHYHTLKECRRRDKRTIEEMLSLRPSLFLWQASKMEVEACGASAIALTEAILSNLGMNRAVLLKWGNSSEAGIGTERVVGYSAVAFLEQDPDGLQKLNEKEKEYLFKVSRKAIKNALEGEIYTPSEPPTAKLKKPSGVFVTLKKKGFLRGCIGYIKAIKPLYIATSEVAVAAAFRDPRFPPLKKEELKDLKIEISVLTDPKITFPSRVKVGRDGLIVEYMGRSGVLLPQVPVEEGWDRIQFLNSVCMKAGVEPDCWRKGARLYSFQAEVFKEK